MHPFPHAYTLSAIGTPHGDVELSAEGLPTVLSDSPAEFDGPGDRWSPEALLVAAVADCFTLTFRAVSRSSRLDWTVLRCHVTGTLDRIDRVTRFTAFEVHAHLAVPAGVDPALARRLLEKAEHGCLITNSLKARVDLIAEIDVASAAAEPELALAR